MQPGGLPGDPGQHLPVLSQWMTDSPATTLVPSLVKMLPDWPAYKRKSTCSSEKDKTPPGGCTYPDSPLGVYLSCGACLGGVPGCQTQSPLGLEARSRHARPALPPGPRIPQAALAGRPAGRQAGGRGLELHELHGVPTQEVFFLEEEGCWA